MNKAILFLTPLLFSTCFAWADVQIKNDQTYVGDDGTQHLVGEIQNNLSAPLSQITITAKFYDSTNSLVFTKTTSPLAGTIMPEMKAPFDILLTEQEAEKFVHYSLEPEFKVGTAKNQVIDITESKMNHDDYDNMFITGLVTNKGQITANIISVVATMYDREGNVAAVAIAHPEPDYLKVNDESFFIIPIQDKNQAGNIVDYSLMAESDEYTAVPEFPIGSLILLALSVFSYIGITRYTGRVITNLVCASNPK